MSDQTKKSRPKVMRGRDTKRRKTFLLQVEPPSGEYPDGVWYRVKRLDLPSLFMEGIIPAPLLAAVDRLQDVRRRFHDGDAIGAMDAMAPENRAQMLELMRRCCVAAVLEPRMTHSKAAAQADEDLLWIGGYSDVDADQKLGQPVQEEDGDVPKPYMMTVWRAVLGEAGLVVMNDEAAEEFRESEPGTHAAAVEDGNGVRAEAVVVDSHGGSPQAPEAVRATGTEGGSQPDQVPSGAKPAVEFVAYS